MSYISIINTFLFIEDIQLEKQKNNNKKWNERKNLDKSKQKFLEQTVEEWKEASEQERLEFLSKAPPARNSCSRITTLGSLNWPTLPMQKINFTR